MPTYDYMCEVCGEFEVQQSMTDPPLENCPECGGRVRRLVSGGTGFIMKGQGGSRSHCDRETPCCGQKTRCDHSPCGK